MYIPKHFAQTDRKLLIEVMSTHSFALLISTKENGEPFVSHLPLIVREDGDQVMIEGHMARANPHNHYLENNPRALIVFNGPHAYVSPSLYQNKESVPSWNYIAVHAYGQVALIHGETEKHAAQTRMIAAMDPAYRSQFDGLSEKYLQGMINAIVAFEFTVERLEGKFKLSQNRPTDDRRNVASALGSGGDEQRALASWMRRMSVDE